MGVNVTIWLYYLARLVRFKSMCSILPTGQQAGLHYTDRTMGVNVTIWLYYLARLVRFKSMCSILPTGQQAGLHHADRTMGVNVTIWLYYLHGKFDQFHQLLQF